MKNNIVLFIFLLSFVISSGQSKNRNLSKYKQTETWSVDDLMKLAKSKGISALYGIVNPTQILYVDKTQLSKLFRLEKKRNINFNGGYNYDQYNKVLGEVKYLSWNNDNLITLSKRYPNARSLVVNDRKFFISALSSVLKKGDTFLIIIHDKDKVYFRIEHEGLGGADAYLGIIKANKLKLICLWSIAI